MKPLKICLLHLLKELTNAPNFSEFTVFEDLSTKRRLSVDLWIFSSGCYKRNEPLGDKSVWDL